MDGNHSRTATHTEGRSERKRDARTDGGYILVTLGLMIIPLMAFAALAVDVGSFYARTTELQKAADAAALSGVIWSPNYTTARTVAAQTLTNDNFTATSAASQTNGNITITMTAGGAPDSFKVCITDAKPDTFFAKVFTSSSPSLTRCATALYYLPVPMGSPLTYFGGDASKYGLPVTTTTNGGPTNYTYPPANTSTTTYTSTLQKNANGNYACKVADPTLVPGNWKYYGKAGPPPVGTNTAPTGTGVPNPLPTCTWSVTWVTTTTAPGPQPITYTSPGFWANVMGPESDAVNGDAHSPRCYGGNLCGSPASPANNDYRASGYTYTLTVPTTGAPTSIAFQVFDAGLYPRSSQSVETGDSIDNNSSGSQSNFTTDFQMFNADSTPLDVTDNTTMTAAQCGGTAGDQTPNSGHWRLAVNDASATFKNNWVTLCTITSPTPGAVYLIRVKTDHDIDGTTQGSGSNRYALQAIGSGGSGTGLQLSAYSDMEIYNNISGGTASFYLADVAQQYAGKTLDVNLWDPGDVGSGTTADITVVSPDTSGTAMTCDWSSNYGVGYASAPSGGNGFGGTPSSPSSSSAASAANCTIESATSGTSHFNGLWLHIRAHIPSTYTCTDAGGALPGCWWQIHYVFTGGGAQPTDNTTWAVNVEGDPIHLVQ
jgi:Flp pilus assembly protein TadG